MMTSGRALSMAAISFVAAAIRSGRVLERDGVGRRDWGDLPDVDDDPEQVDNLFDVRVAQVKRLDDRLFVFATLGGRIRDDRDRALCRHAVERPRCGRHRRQRVGERGLAQIDRDWRLTEGRVEDDVEPGETRQRREDRATARRGEKQGVRQRGIFWKIESGRREIASAIQERLQLGFSTARHRDLVAEELPRFPERSLHLRIGRIELRGELILDSSLFDTVRRSEATPAKCCWEARSRATCRASRALRSSG
jgi:hypothetical protein